ncbi:MAG TPA: hypothetical protein VH681_00675 [Nitrospiraceae bacterium]|jgi:general secretion pathway protein C
MTVRRGIILVYLACGTFLVAHALSAVLANALHVSPELLRGPVSSSREEGVAISPTTLAEQIRLRGIFPLPPDPVAQTPEGRASASAPVRGALNLASKLRLLGVVMGDRGGVGAIVEELASKRQLFVRLHGTIVDAGEVTEIRRDGIAVRQGDQQDWLELAALQSDKPLPPPVTPVGMVKPSTGAMRKMLDRREVDQAMNDLPKLLSQARAVPYLVNGAMNGFRLDYVAPASFYEKIGLQHGDILQQVNGVEIKDPATMLTLFQQLRNEQTVKLDVLRNNQRSTLTYDIR